MFSIVSSTVCRYSELESTTSLVTYLRLQIRLLKSPYTVARLNCAPMWSQTSAGYGPCALATDKATIQHQIFHSYTLTLMSNMAPNFPKFNNRKWKDQMAAWSQKQGWWRIVSGDITKPNPSDAEAYQKCLEQADRRDLLVYWRWPETPSR